MKRRLFLSGPAFCGKSELIRQQLGTRLQWAGGFCTELSASEDDSFGCRMMPAAMAGGVKGYEKELFLDLRSNPPAHDSEVFRQTGVRLLEEAVWYPFAVLDEIGGIDLIIPQFRIALDSLLASELPILGVLKTPEESENLRRLLGPGERFRAFSERLHAMLEEDPDTEIVRIGTNAASEAAEAVAGWIETWISQIRI